MVFNLLKLLYLQVNFTFILFISVNLIFYDSKYYFIFSFLILSLISSFLNYLSRFTFVIFNQSIMILFHSNYLINSFSVIFSQSKHLFLPSNFEFNSTSVISNFGKQFVPFSNLSSIITFDIFSLLMLILFYSKHYFTFKFMTSISLKHLLSHLKF